MLYSYSQWLQITIYAENMDLTIKEVKITWGKFFKNENKYSEINKELIEGSKISSGNYMNINACGREDSASGTAGSFKIYHKENYIGQYSWSCPWGIKTNISNWDPVDNNNYHTNITGGNTDSGAIGNVYITCIKIR